MRTGGSRGQRCSALVGISHINMHANDSTAYALPLKSAHCSKGWVRDKIRRDDVVAVVGRIECLAGLDAICNSSKLESTLRIPAHKCQDQEFADAWHLHRSGSELVHESWSEAGLGSTCSAGRRWGGVREGSRRLELMVEDEGTQRYAGEHTSPASKVIKGGLCFDGGIFAQRDRGCRRCHMTVQRKKHQNIFHRNMQDRKWPTQNRLECIE